MDYLELLCGQIPEAIYFSIFIILGKSIKTKRILFMSLMILGYAIIEHIFPMQIMFQINYTAYYYFILKLLYKEKAQIIDIFLFIFSVVVLGIFSIPLLMINSFIGSIYVTAIISKIILFITLIITRKKISVFYKIFCEHWNRNDSKKRKIKSLTVRNISIIVFNITFVLMNIVMLYLR